MVSKFTAEDGTKMIFEIVEEIFGCQRFKVSVESQPPPSPRELTLVRVNTEGHFKTLEILLKWGMCDFKDFPISIK